MFTSISGRSVLVTGGTKGIGHGIVRQMLLAGAKVALTSRTAVRGRPTSVSGAASVNGTAACTGASPVVSARPGESAAAACVTGPRSTIFALAGGLMSSAL